MFSFTFEHDDEDALLDEDVEIERVLEDLLSVRGDGDPYYRHYRLLFIDGIPEFRAYFDVSSTSISA